MNGESAIDLDSLLLFIMVYSHYLKCNTWQVMIFVSL